MRNRRGGRALRVYGCLFSRGRPLLLRRGNGPVIVGARLRGRFVALAGSSGDDQTIEVVDLVRRRSALAATRQGWGTTRFVLGRRGSVAWISLREPVDGAPLELDVRTLDRRGETLLDAGPDIGRRSLALGGQIAPGGPEALYWTNGDTARSAPLR